MREKKESRLIGSIVFLNDQIDNAFDVMIIFRIL